MKSLLKKMPVRVYLSICASLLGMFITPPSALAENLSEIDVVQQSAKKIFGKVT